jgi:xanthine dehydrogenase molybdopterin-binding subunit B
VNPSSWVDPETGKVTILRFVAAQDVGCAIHPSYVEGQIQGGVAQGIGWALNEEYIYDRQGRLDNAGFLDYRVPVASDMPMIEAVMVEVPNPAHPYGAKGVGEVNIVPPMGRSPTRSTARSTAASRNCRCRRPRSAPPSIWARRTINAGHFRHTGEGRCP